VSSRAALFFASRVLGLRERGAGSARYLRGAIIGVALSIVPLVVVMVVSDGMIEGITARYIEVGTYHLQAKPFFAVGREELEEKAESIRSRPGIKAAFPEYQCPGLAILGSRTEGVALRAVAPSFLEDPGVVEYLTVTAGEARLDSTNQILLGEALARNLGAKVGDAVSVATGKSGGEAPKISIFKVRGIVSAGYRGLDALWAFVSLRAGGRIAQAGSASIPLIGIKVDEPYGNLEAARRAVYSALATEGGAADWTVLTWPETERNVYKSFTTTKAILLLVMAVAVAVAAINVSSALVMLVLERRKDIAILKSAGASPGFIGRVFVIAGLGVGSCGTLLGILAGSLLSWRINDVISLAESAVNAASRLMAILSGAASPRSAIHLLDPSYYLATIPVHIDLGELGIVASLSLLLCLLASLVPARRAARLPPLEIFRKT
jgi:lipoprotein-releasing system permease protein